MERATGQAVTVKSPTVRASAILAAREDLAKKREEEIKTLNEHTATYKKKLAEAKKFNEADTKAMEARVKELNVQLDSLNAKILGLSGDLVKRSQDVQLIRDEAARRRADVFRLTRELTEIQTDHSRSEELERKLRDQLVRLDGVIASLETRNKQLREAVGNASR
jgi:chromosome segregation ATPase